MEFAGRTGLITGSGALGGLGHATAGEPAAGGAGPVLTGRDPRRGAEVVADLRGVAADGGRTAI
jgi:NAD(P)-dependent dehydrogenase (short-subunit alcohol dehydrogenase family)